MKLFDRNIGKGFLDTVPAQPGIYRIYNTSSQVIYVGKAKNLKRRLAQYKNAKRRKKHRKMRKIIQDASHIEVEICGSHLEAQLLETQLIQILRPKWNIAGAFYFLYPFIGMKFTPDETYFCYTTEPALFQDFELHGTFRSRKKTREAFFALVRLLPYLSHRLPLRRSSTARKIPKYSHLIGFRKFPKEWKPLWDQFWKGESKEALEALVLALIENADARKDPEKIQEYLNHLARFWKHEATPLAKARVFNQYASYPVLQKDRDLIFLKYRSREELVQE